MASVPEHTMASVPDHRRHGPVKTVEHFGTGVNAKIAVLITEGVGTMVCAYLFAIIALISLPAALSSGSVIVIVAWIAQTFLQLVLLSIIMVGQRVQSSASDARSEHEFKDVTVILDRLDEHTEGGIKAILDRLPPR